MNIEADNRTCEQIASSEEYRTRVAEEHRLIDERLDQPTTTTNVDSSGHDSYISPLCLYYQGFELDERGHFVLKVFSNDPSLRIATDGSVLNNLEQKRS